MVGRNVFGLSSEDLLADSSSVLDLDFEEPSSSDSDFNFLGELARTKGLRGERGD